MQHRGHFYIALTILLRRSGVMLNGRERTDGKCHNPILNHYLFVQCSGVLKPLEALKIKGLCFEHWTFWFNLSSRKITKIIRFLDNM